MIANSAMFEPEKHREVVVTGFGLVTPLGASADDFFAALRSGRSAISAPATPATGNKLPPGALVELAASAAVARVQDFGAAVAIDAGRRRRMPRIGQFCVVAAQQALGCEKDAAGVTLQKPPPVVQHYGSDRVGVVLGTGLGALDTTLEFTTQYLEGGLGAGSPALFPYTVMNTAAALVAMELQLLGPNLTVNHRDLSFAEALASACDLLRCGHLDAVLAGGCDELGDWLLHAYARLGILSSGGDMRPYDRERRGLCPGEGAVLVLLEREAAAKARGATIAARIAGIGRHGDDRPRLGWLRPAEAPRIEGAAQSVRLCLDAAGETADMLDFIAGSGNGTELETLETQALRAALGTAAEHVPIASVLGQTGEWMTSAGVRLLSGLYALKEQALPGTHCANPDSAASLPGLVQAPRAAQSPVRSVLVPTFAQGGGNVSLLLTAA